MTSTTSLLSMPGILSSWTEHLFPGIRMKMTERISSPKTMPTASWEILRTLTQEQCPLDHTRPAHMEPRAWG